LDELQLKFNFTGSSSDFKYKNVQSMDGNKIPKINTKPIETTRKRSVESNLNKKNSIENNT
jgi:hypothetical protein